MLVALDNLFSVFPRESDPLAWEIMGLEEEVGKKYNLPLYSREIASRIPHRYQNPQILKSLEHIKNI